MELPEVLCYQKLHATNDNNGNPQRCFVVYDHRGNPMEVIDEGYNGRPAKLRGLVELSEVKVTVSEYRVWMRLGKQLANEDTMKEPSVGCNKCGATDIPVIGHEPCPG